MIGYIQKIGNSLGVYIPKVYAEEMGLEPKSVVEIKAENGVLTVTPIKRHEYRLDDLLSQITPENLHGEADTGNAVGGEVW